MSGVDPEASEPDEPNYRRRPRKTHPEFGEGLLFAYPIHLRQAIDDLPSLPGVYTFHGEDGDLPLYIGKSINIRSRVLSHLRTPDEARLLRQTRRITCIRTAGEIGALLLESHMIKTQQPLHNQRLRRSRQLFAWHYQGSRPELVSAKDVDFGKMAHLFGLYASRHSALNHLRALADEHGLCLGVLGLEKYSLDKACFRAQLKSCQGACCGRETLQSHQSRLEAALAQVSVVCWPYPAAVALVERQQDLQDIHVVQNWCYLGSVGTLEEATVLGAVHASFDADSYRILCRPLVQGSVEVVLL